MPQEIIRVTCPQCHRKNSFFKQSTKGIYKCGYCKHQLSNLSSSPTVQPQSALNGRKSVLRVLAGVGLLVLLGHTVSSGSQSSPISSRIAAPPQMVPNPPLTIERENSLPSSPLLVSPTTSADDLLSVTNGTSLLSSASVAPPQTAPNPPLVIARNRSLPSSTVLVSPATSGGGSLKVTNGTNRAAYIKLVDPRSRTLVAAFYVKSNSIFTLKQVPDGTYQVLFVLGEDWDAKTQSLTGSKHFSKFDRSLNFTTTQLSDRIEYTVFQLTLHPVVGGNATTSSVDEREFTRY